MVLKRILVICLVLSLLTGSLIFMGSCEIPETLHGSNRGAVEEGTINSDGRKYTPKVLETATILSELPEGESLPVVGDRETLLKILLERGALYDNSPSLNKRSNDGFDSLSDPVPDAIPAPAAPAGADVALGTTVTMEQAEMESPGFSGDFDDSSSPSHSETNEQVAGIREGDIVKTDGQYLYALSLHDSKIRIIEVNGADLKVVSIISWDGIWGNEFYIIGNDRLAVVGGEHVQIQPLPASDDQPSARAEADSYYYGWHGNSFTTLIIFDISNRSAPHEIRRVSMDGWSVSTRVIGGIVYMVTNKYMWGIPMDQADSHLIMPYTRDTVEGTDYEPMDFDRIHYVPGTDDTNYLLIGAVDVYDNAAFEPTAYLGAGSNLYMSHNAMYITQHKWVQEQISGSDDRVETWWSGSIKTEIMRFAIFGTSVVYSGKGMVDGTPINQYSMDEHNGFFRIATTDWSEGTYVTVLNASTMQTVGRTAPLAPGEMMHSMRFMGDMGYVVTFLNVDPLFTIDLSDPYNPRMLGELKIPGFSQYLHPVGDGLLLGIGRDTQEIYTRDANGVETVVGFQDTGMRVTLFDVKNPYDPREVDVLKLGEGWAEVSHNPRAFMNDPSRGQYGFIAESWNNTRGINRTTAFILRVENERLSIAATLDPTLHYGSWGSRLCFIGNYLYVVHGTGVVVYDYNSYGMLNNFNF